MTPIHQNRIIFFIRSTGDNALMERTCQSLSLLTDISFSYFIYDVNEDLSLIWSNNYKDFNLDYVLFINEGDLINGRLSQLKLISLGTDITYLKFPRTDTYPCYHEDELGFERFYEGRVRSCFFLFKASYLSQTPDFQTQMGEWGLITLVLKELFLNRKQIEEIDLHVFETASYSLTSQLDVGKMLCVIMPNLFPNFQEDYRLLSQQNKKRYYARRLNRVSNRIEKTELFVKALFPGSKRKMIAQRLKYWNGFKSKYEDNWKKIPVIINNFNRLDCLLKLITSLEKRGMYNIHILDNDSTYPPLLEYYSKTTYTVHFLKRNVGYKALWESEIFPLFKNDYYIYTDPDVEIAESCPDDFIDFFISLLKKYPMKWKVGFSLKIDDLPDCYNLKNQVINWEKQFFRYELEPGIFDAAIDTTFALYKPFLIENIDDSIRVGFPYELKHLPWYSDTENPSEEDVYYAAHSKTLTHWSNQKKL